MRQLALVLVCGLAACQPQARRLLLLDLALTEPAALEATAAPWRDAGYTVDYRRFYPHLTRRDLSHYQVVLLLGGREPEAASDALDAGDLALLTGWIPRGGILMFGYGGDGEGYLDRWVMNRWLAAMGVGITIGDFALRDTARSPAGAEPVREGGGLVRDAGFEPFPFGRAHVLVVHDAAEALARASRTAFVRVPGKPPASRPSAAIVAAHRLGDGLVVIASRHTLGVLDPDLRGMASLPPELGARARARRFLVALARWTRRPAEWARLPVAGHPRPLSLLAAPALPPRRLAARAPQLAPPAGVSIEPLPARPARDSAGATGVPGWIRRAGMRVLWGREFTLPGLDSLVGFLEAGAFNVFASVADPGGADTLARRGANTSYWPAVRLRILADRLQQTSVGWIPGLEFSQFRPPPEAHERGIGGDSLPAWCSLDAGWWDDALTPGALALARLAAIRRDLVLGLAFDLRPPPPTAGRIEDRASGGMGAGFCDATYVLGLRALGLDSAETERLSALPAEARYGALLERGALEAYYGALEREVALRAAALRTAVRRVRPDLLFAFRLDAPPTDWFTLGLLRGFSTADTPLLLWTREPQTAELLARYRARGINAIHAMALPPVGGRGRDWSRLGTLLFDRNDGFWTTTAEVSGGVPARADSLARMIRRLGKQR